MALEINLEGKRAVVSGVSSGIGLGIARKLAQAGCDVSGCGLDGAESEGAARFIDAVKSTGRRARYQSLDLARPDEIETWVKAAAEWMDGIDIVISNAGANFFEGVEGTGLETWQRNLDVNLGAHWRLVRAAYLYLKKNDPGVVVVIASNHANYTMPGCFPYNVAKAGIKALVQSIAIEWGPAVRAVAVAPGYVRVEATQAWFNRSPDPAAEEKRVKSLHPVFRMGSVDEIGALCAFLASEWGGFITGTTLLIDGGRSALMQDGVNYGE